MSVEEIGRDGSDPTVHKMFCATCDALYDELDEHDQQTVPPHPWSLVDRRDDPDEPDA